MGTAILLQGQVVGVDAVGILLVLGESWEEVVGGSKTLWLRKQLAKIDG